jgi:hypothetical protein
VSVGATTEGGYSSATTGRGEHGVCVELWWRSREKEKEEGENEEEKKEK